MDSIIKDLLERMDVVIENVKGMLPAAFSEEVAKSVFDGMQGIRNRLKTVL